MASRMKSTRVTNKELIENLRQAVEKAHRTNAKYKEKAYVRLDEGKLKWAGDVFVFELIHNSKQGSSKEEIANWTLQRPTPASVQAAEQRGQAIRKAFQASSAMKAKPLRQAKVAYAWSAPVGRKKKPELHVVLQRGQVRSPVDAVKAFLNG
jgi:hypothetical protein